MALKYCPECGNKLPENAKFCPDCGYKLEIPDETSITPEPEVVEEPEMTQSRPTIDMVDVKDVKPSKNTVVWAVLGLALCFVSCCGITSWMSLLILCVADVISIYNLMKVKRWKPLSIVAIIFSIVFLMIWIWCVFIIPDNKDELVSSTQAIKESVENPDNITDMKIETAVAEEETLRLTFETLDDVRYMVPEAFEKEEIDGVVMYSNEDSILMAISLPNIGIKTATRDKAYNVLEDIIYELVINNDGFKDITYIDTARTKDLSYGEYIICAMPKTRVHGNIINTNRDYTITAKAIYRQGYDCIYVTASFAYAKDDSYLAVENQIMNSVRIGEPTEVSSTTSSTGVSKEVKEFVDGFESFFNKYVDVMKSVSNGSSDLSVLGEYATLLSEYADWMNKIEEFESKDMTAEDSKYFWDAYARVMNNLTSAGLSNN